MKFKIQLSRRYAPVKEMRNLIKSMRGKGAEFDHVVKMGRTQLQDAVPMTLGQGRLLERHELWWYTSCTRKART